MLETIRGHEATKKIIPEHKRILDMLRALYVKSGGELCHKPEEWGLIPFGRSEEGLEIDFHNGVPENLYTTEGHYIIFGSHQLKADTIEFWRLLNENFKVETLIPERGVNETNYTGPLVRIKEKRKEKH